MHTPRGEPGVQLDQIIHDAAAELEIARAFFAATPQFESAGLYAEIGGGFLGVELLTGHIRFSFHILAVALWLPACFERRIPSLRNSKICRSVLDEKKNLRVL